MNFDHAKGLASEFSAAQKTVIGLLAIMAFGAAVGGWLQWAKDAPIVVGENSAHVSGHHDSITALFDATSEQVSVLRGIEDHLHRDSLAKAVSDRQLGYLVCIRIERKRELEGRLPDKDCDRELLEGR
jgi:hypothetical protein